MLVRYLKYLKMKKKFFFIFSQARSDGKVEMKPRRLFQIMQKVWFSWVWTKLLFDIFLLKLEMDEGNVEEIEINLHNLSIEGQ
jgi:hypothetical protein